MTAYPTVIGERETLRLVLQGASIARYGDGEFKMCRDVGIKNHDVHPTLSQRLRDILLESGDCLVGIPNLRSETPKAGFWSKFAVYAGFLTNRTYYSSFITRPDSAPWINTPEYWKAMESLWRGQDITLVRGSGKSLSATDVEGAGTVHEILAPRRSAFEDYDAILARVLAVKPARVLIGLGPAATVLAVDLCARGIHALDLGHAAMFLRKYRRGEPMIVTEDEKALEAYPS